MPKNKLRGLLALGKVLNYATIARELGVTIVEVKRWEKEIAKEQLTQDIVEIATEPDETKLEINPETGVIEIVGPEKVVKTVAKSKMSPTKFRDSVEGLRLLSEEIQSTAGGLVTEIANQVEIGELSARDLAALTSAITSIQNAFFNKPTTNVQVNTVNAGGESLLQAFKKGLKS